MGGANTGDPSGSSCPSEGARQRVLFVSHDASATGAPNSLLNFLDQVAAEGTFDFRVVLLRGGPLEDRFRAVGPVMVVRPDLRFQGPRWKRAWQKLITLLPPPKANRRWKPREKERRRFQEFTEGFAPDLIYLNSVAAAPALAYLADSPVPVLTFVRELGEYIEATIATGWFGELKKRTEQFMSVSAASRDFLVKNYGLPKERFEVLHTFVDTAKLAGKPRDLARQQLMALMPSTDFETVVIGCGTTDWRKGPDLFIQAAKVFFELLPHNRAGFVWLGGLNSKHEIALVNREIERCGVRGKVFFPGAQKDAAEIIAGADVLALTSREDPFPRVMLEAGIAGIPTVCFHGSGGGAEFVAHDTGIAVGFEDVPAFGRALAKLCEDVNLRHRMGENARIRVLTEHDSKISSQRLLAKVKTLAAIGRMRSIVGK